MPALNIENNLERIERFDDGPQGINAVTWVNPNALSTAAELDRERKATGLRSPVHGFTFLVKDNIDVAGIPTTAGSAALAQAIPPDDADVVARLRSSGAILLGKTNMSELALSYGWLGYSATGGLTRNPYDLRRNASGSSSGSAAAVAAGFADFALGTDTAGSIRGPASVTGLVGLKPTHNLVSLDGIAPLSPSLDVVGPIAPNVRTAGLVLAQMMNSHPLQKRLEKVLQEGLEERTPNKKVIGVVSPIPSGHADVERAVREAVAALSGNGVHVIEIELPESRRSLWPILIEVVEAEFAAALNRYLASVAGGPADLEALIELSARDGRINPARLEGLRKAAAAKASERADKERNLLRKRITALFAKHNLEAIAFPTIACSASPVYNQPDDRYTCDYENPYTVSYVANATGFPEITVPVGVTRHGLPIGLSLLGQSYSEDKLIALGLMLESVVEPAPAPQLGKAGLN